MMQAKEMTNQQLPKPIRSDVWPDKLTTLHSIQAYLRELREGAEANGEQFLQYLIGMAYLETGDRIRELYAKGKEAEARRENLEAVD